METAAIPWRVLSLESISQMEQRLEPLPQMPTAKEALGDWSMDPIMRLKKKRQRDLKRIRHARTSHYQKIIKG